MRVLMQNRPRQWVGGDMVKLDKVMEELKKLGVEVDYNDQPLFTPALLLQSYDIVHCWNFSMEWTKYQVWAAVKHKRKLVCSMIYHESDRFIPYDSQQIMLDALDAAIYETEGEIERVKRHLRITPHTTHIIGNGVDSWWFDKDEGKVPFKGYLLTVGRIERSKGQLEVAQACRDLGLKYVCIGEAIDQPYVDQVLAQGAILYPAMDQKKLKKWYKNADIYAQVSLAETWGMAVDEAGTQGTKLLLSTGLERKDIPDAVYCEYENLQSITKGIEKLLKQKKSLTFRNQLKKRTWKHVAKEYLKIYKTLV